MNAEDQIPWDLAAKNMHFSIHPTFQNLTWITEAELSYYSVPTLIS